ncbi:MAG TPA: Gfo/Idh/MocA family oxidoreductase [Methylomirabilota bacterium]|nr:Gfo/Idh/MocA family oxidoreductase [Methylomirabilota bacterium]
MNETSLSVSTRREFIKTSGRLAAASALAGVALPHVHAAENNTVQIALIGCGGRGTGAAANALSRKGGPIELTAMVDVFPHKLNSSYENLKKAHPGQVAVREDRMIIGFDGYKKAMDALKPGDIAILATPPAFRWVHFKYAIERGLHVFMEKPICVDAPTGRRMIELGEKAKEKNLKVGVGLMVRHCRGRQALYNKIRRGAIGDIIALRAYRMHPPVASAFTDPSMRKQGQSELLFQINRFHSFLWASGGLFSDFYIHQIDECCWMKDAWPVKCHAVGGRHYRGKNIDQNFDVYQVEYTFADGSKFFFYGRTMPGVKDEFSSFAHGSEGMATISLGGHHLGRAGRIFAGQNMRSEDQLWAAFPEGGAPDPYEAEWDDLLDAIRNDKPYNEVKRGAEASMVTAMGRFAAHTGQEVTWEDYYNNEHEFAPDVDKLTMESPAPIQADADGKYPVPQPGIVTKREY